MQIEKIKNFSKDFLNNRDFTLFALSIALLLPLMFFEGRREVVADSLLSLLVLLMLSFPFGLIPLGIAVMFAQSGLFEADSRAGIVTFLLFLIMFLIGFFQWFVLLNHRPGLLKIRFWLVRVALVIAVLPLAIKGVLFFRSI